ncbi:Fic family protein [Sporosarcina sp. FA9]|uniref:Fic family protein n=1 Tax=Sporosarcina sp. FA9 TaxID=3413030 RepID=UPI003F65F1BF
MKRPYDLPLLPITFDAKTELEFYRKVVTASSMLEKLKEKLHYSLVNTSFLELLTLLESVQSTRIEGTQVTFSDMLEDQLESSHDWKRTEVRNYQVALQMGIEEISIGYPLNERLIRNMHKVLMKDGRSSANTAGEYRRIQNFVGPTNEIKDASYIPPKPQKMADYMSNLELYINGKPYAQEVLDDLHPLIKCAIIHAQFESIHPFLDGNGRLGRILIVLVLLQTKLIDSPFFFLSEELESEKFKYYTLLNGVRGIGKIEPDWQSWIHFFLDSAIRMAERQYKQLDEAEALYETGKSKLENPSAIKVWGALFTHPITNVAQLVEDTKLSPATVRKSLNWLVELNLIYADDRKRNRRYYFYDLIRIIQG